MPAREHGAVEVSTTVEAMQSVELGCAVDSFARRKTTEERRTHTQTRTTKQQNNKTTNDGYSIGVRYTIVLTADSNEQQ